MSDRFHNPYNFIPALPRDRQHSELGDSIPKPHGVYAPNCWSGRIAVTLTTETPLLILDAAKAAEDKQGHKTYPLRVGSDNKPYLPPTSIKGMLRSTYEAVTNSRLSVFVKHDDRLAYRMAAEGNRIIYPARVKRTETDELQIRILQAREVSGKVGKLPRYRTKAERDDKGKYERDKGEGKLALPYHESSTLPKHKDCVWVRLNPRHDNPQDDWEHELSQPIRENLLESENRGKKIRSTQLLENVVTRIQQRDENSQPPGEGKWHKGWVCITGANIKDKCYERVFIESDNDPVIPVNEKLKQLWKDLILNYQQEHESDLKKRQEDRQQPEDYTGDNSGDTAWSTHVYQQGIEELTEGTLCYVELTQDLKELTQDLKDLPTARSLPPERVKAILPVMLSRRLYELSPASLLGESLHPARTLSELSPADRVFGWVRQQKSETETRREVAYKGNLRIHSVVCCSNDLTKDIRDFGKAGLPLAILGQPKPEQARFYAAADRQGTAYRGNKKQDGYRAPQTQGLRGRKVYPHHRNLPEGYWNPDKESFQVGNYYQEYRRLKEEGKAGSDRDNQNRSIQQWVEPKVRFEFEIDVTNLTDVELGALLWLLQLEPEHYHRLGSGKPLGFGSVRLEIDWSKTDLRTGADWKTFYRSLTVDEPPTRSPEAAEATISAFKRAIEAVHGARFEQVSFIAAFLRAAKGFEDGIPIHYPRTQAQPNPAGEGFKWFVENEKTTGKKLSLPELTQDEGLPLKPAN